MEVKGKHSNVTGNQHPTVTKENYLRNHIQNGNLQVSLSVALTTYNIIALFKDKKSELLKK